MKWLLHNRPALLVVSATLLVLAFVVHNGDWLTRSPQALHQAFEQALHQKEARLQEELRQLTQRWNEGGFAHLQTQHADHYGTLLEDEGFALMVYDRDSLVFWSDNALPMDPDYANQRWVRGNNGWYAVQHIRVGTLDFIGLLLVKYTYPIHNQYLNDRFQRDFELPRQVTLLPNPATGLLPLQAQDGSVLAHVHYPSTAFPIAEKVYAVGLLNILGLLVLLLFLHAQSIHWQPRLGEYGSLALFGGSLILVRLLMIIGHFPAAFYDLPAFGPEQYAASELLPSFGDLFLNILLVFYLAYYLHQRLHLTPELKARINRQFPGWVALGLSGLLFFLAVVCGWVIEGLIDDSDISFNVNNLFELDLYSYASMAVIGMMLFAFLLITDKCLSLITSLKVSARALLNAAALPFALYAGYLHSIALANPVRVLWPLAVLLIVFQLKHSRQRAYSFNYTVLLISVFTLFAANAISYHTGKKENVEQRILAEKLSIDEDPVTEAEFAAIEDELLQDSILQALMVHADSFDMDRFSKRLEEHYFNGYFTKYMLKSVVFDPDGNLIDITGTDFWGKLTLSPEFFEQVIRNFGKLTFSPNFYFIDNPNNPVSYILKIKQQDTLTESTVAVAYVFFESRLISDKIGFPDLLLDHTTQLDRNVSKYSFARYYDGRLSFRYGKYPYSLNASNYDTETKPFGYLQEGAFRHTVYEASDALRVVLSKPTEGRVAKATTFSYLFGFFGLLVLILLSLRSVASGKRLKKLSFNSKIQLLLVLVILTSLILFGVGTTYYIYRQNAVKNNANINEKIQSVLIEVTTKLSDYSNLEQGPREYYNRLMEKFSNVFFTDINLYSLDGSLLSSSRLQIFEEGLAAPVMNPTAYHNMTHREMKEFVHEERIGRLRYLSAYVPFYSKDDEMLAYLNLSYVAKQSELEREIASYLVALINIYVLLFAVSVVAALLISNFITQPLRLIQNMLSRVELGKVNKPIEYEGQDEIGRLVAVYNKKVTELEQSAELLARSERESAWREMAKQVAHEIKNPLTPMKLSVQHLLRSYKDNPENWGDRLSRFSTTIIEQIDTLSVIASEFSNFAKMPKAVNERLNLREVLSNSVDLFRDQPGLVVQDQSIREGGAVPVFADKDQLTRVFNNLLKNAKQAIPEDRKGKLEVYLRQRNDMATVEIKDNGTGIPPERIDRIFQPNFTTKTSGMGLGLSMVKNMVEEAGGRVWFQTEIDQGTSFFVTLPLHPDEAETSGENS